MDGAHSLETPARKIRLGSALALSVAALLVAACGGKASRPPATTTPGPPVEPPPVETVAEPEPVAPVETDAREDELARIEPADDILARSLEDLNADSPLPDIHFEFDSAALTDEARRRLESHAEWLLRHPTVRILIEGHCDERGTVEYNLALGERRAKAAYDYLQSLGVPPERMKIISYGKEFPLDPRHDEEAWAKNRRAHFVITAK